MGRRIYETISGFFVQDKLNDSALSDNPPTVPPRLGLIDDSEDRWPKFFAHIKRLNDHADKDTSYKVFFIGRHGEAYHNVGIKKYREEIWEEYWSKLNGDGEITWGPDADLTPLGRDQAVLAHDAWNAEFKFKLPAPGSIYCSPLTRALKTCEITFESILSDNIKRPLVVENCREMYGVRTPNNRRSRTYIETTFPKFSVEDGLTEHDLLCDPDVRETQDQVTERVRKVLDMIFDNDEETFISITTHGLTIIGFLATVGRPPYYPPTGGVLPMVIKSVYS